jgi:prophage antirepressor-like protein
MDTSMFQFKGHNVRTAIGENGQTLFVGKDVCAVLGYTNPSKAMSDHCKGLTIRHPIKTAGGLQNLRVLTEPDVIRLVVSSHMPGAEAFERWVFEDVLPTIRRTGRYGPASPAERIDEMISSGQLKGTALVYANFLKYAGSDKALPPSFLENGLKNLLAIQKEIAVAD